MFKFDLKKSILFSSLNWQIIFRYFNALEITFYILFLLSLASIPFFELSLGLTLILLGIALCFSLGDEFFSKKMKNLDPGATLSEISITPERYNLADFLEFDAANAVFQMYSWNFKEITSTHLFYFLLLTSNKCKFVLERLCLDYEKILKDAWENLKGSDFKEALLGGLDVSRKKNKKKISEGDLLIALSMCDPFFKKVLVEENIKTEDVENMVWWLDNVEARKEKKKRFWDYDNLMLAGSLAKTWTAGYTISLDKYSTDWSEKLRKFLPETIGYETELDLTERILAGTGINNALLISEPGAGAENIIYALVKKSMLGQSLPELNFKRIVELDMNALLASAKTIDEAETILNNIFKETVFAGNIILVINNLYNYIGIETKPGIIDISGVLSPYLKMPQFQFIGTTTYAGLHENIERNPNILSLFEKVEIPELDERNTLMILEDMSLNLENRYKIEITYPALKEIINLSKRYMPNSVFPEKAIKILDDVCVYASELRERRVVAEHVAKVMTEKTEIPIGAIQSKEKEILVNLESLIHQRIIAQDEAVKEVAAAMRRARAEISIRKGPIGAFLFLGPTGVGKTETAKALAEFYFGSESKIVRLDMSEFQDVKDIPRLIGTREAPGVLTTAVKENPFSVLLLDEIEKADFNVRNLFLQVLDEGYLKDGVGNKVDFKNMIIIATSNAGYKLILEAIKEGVWAEGVKTRLIEYLMRERVFQPEFLNRFDAVIVFKPLTWENLIEVSNLMLLRLAKNLEAKEIKLDITQDLKEKIADLGYDPVFGARAMRRVVQEKLENPLATDLLSGKIKRGSVVSFNDALDLIIK